MARRKSMARRNSKKSMKGGNAAAAATAEVVPAVQPSQLASSPVEPVSAGAPVTEAAAVDTALKGGSANAVPTNAVPNAAGAPVAQPSEAVRAGSALAYSKVGGSKTLKGGKHAGAKRTRGKCDGKAYCVKCKKMNTITNCVNAVSSNGRNMVKGTCPKCGTKMNKFV